VNKSIKVMAILACMAGGAAHASQVFDFSYTFTDGQSLFGTLTGTEGAGGPGGAFSVSNISNISLTFDGNQFGGTLSAGTYNSAVPAAPWNFAAHAAVVSTNASANNFIIADSIDPAGNNATNYFYFVNGTTPSGSGTSEVLAFNTNTGDIDLDNPAAGAWSLTAAPVPLPAGLPLLGSALGIFGLGAFRRRAAV
jgi:hypothetical protein